MRPFYLWQYISSNSKECELVNKKRLYKSSNVVIGGVCGGIADYFGIDPTLVRIIAVALTIVLWGIPAIAYVIFLIILPPDPGAAQGYVDARAEATKPKSYQDGFEPNGAQAEWVDVAEAAEATATQPPPPDPAARVSAANYHASGDSTTQAAQATQAAPPHKATHAFTDSVRHNSPAVLVVGATLIGIGVIALLSNFVHISLWRFWPVVVIVVGVVTLFTPGSRGWSLQRAGNSIVLITIGVALLAWMLQIISFRVILAAFFDLWPILLVVLGLSIIGGARKNSILSLLSSLLLSATIIIGLWLYGGLDLASVIHTSLLSESDGIQEFLWDITHID